jgi:nitroimidazol reductase NimA-like FMN-containing flavoprotein (pyridoxamine 5'-phosphate oxidase superfamily)
MRRADREIAAPEGIADVLARGEVLRLAMIAPDGWPYVVPLSFAARPGPAGAPLDGLTIYVHSAREGRKLDALRRDPRVCFEVTVDVALVRGERPCDFGVRYRSAVGTGRARLVEDPAERVRALELIAARYAGAATAIPADEAARVAVLAIEVERVTGKASPRPG